MITHRRLLLPLRPRAVEEAAGDWWLSGGIDPANCIIAYQPKGAADYAGSKVNLANPGTYNAADGGAYPDWDVTNGWMGNGSTKYLDTGCTPAADQSESAIIRVSNVVYTVAEKHWFGMRNSGRRIGIASRTDGTNQFNNSGSVNINCSAPASGVFAVAGSNAYYNGSDVGDIGTGTGVPPTMYILARNYSTLLCSDAYVQAFAFYNTVLAGDQISALTTAMAAL